MEKYDVIIIGAGAVGSCVAYMAVKKGYSVCVLEKNPDVCFETSGRNSGVVHSGFNNPPGSLKAKYCTRGSAGFEQNASKLGVPYAKTGKYVVALSPEDETAVDDLISQGEKNGVNVIKTEYDGKPALYSSDTAITDPFKYTIAVAEAAHLCGAEFIFHAGVKAIEQDIGTDKDRTGEDNNYVLTVTFDEKYGQKEYTYRASYIINCAGSGAADICKTAGIDKFEVIPCRGEYHIIDPFFGSIDYPVYPAVRPGADVLGIHLTPTIDGNIMIGPSSEYLRKDQKHDYKTTRKIMDELFEEGKKILPGLTKQALIRSFSGIRPKLTVNGSEYNDFLIEETLPGFINLMGIESPGLTSSMPLAEDVIEMIDLEPSRWNIPKPSLERFPYERMSGASQQICRCESVTANEILSAYDRITSIGAIPTLRGIKHRTRLGMGRCQGGFCTAELLKLLRRERAVNPLQFTYQGNDSNMFTRRTR